MTKYLFGIIAVLCAALCFTFFQMKEANKKWKSAEANVKAYSSYLSNEQENGRALQLTVRQLEYFNDSILKKLNDTREELKIKDKQLKALHYVSSDFSRVDTIKVTQVDTLFKEPTLALDTLIGDEWYSLQLGLKYPNTIAAKTSFKSEKHVVVFTDRETVKPPKKFFLFRWFQKKHTVTLVEVVEKNPYVTGESQRYIELIK